MTTVPLTATYSTAGTFSWNCPPGVTSVTVACTGAGGGAGAAATASGANGGGGGGGEGALEVSVGVTPGLAYTLTVGAGGPGGTQGGPGTAGGDTSFAGDSLTVYAHGGGNGFAAGAAGNGQPGSGGTGSTNSVAADGGDGDFGTAATNGGGGGGAAGTSTQSLVSNAAVGTGFPGGDGSGSTGGDGGGGQFPGGAGGNGATTGAAGSAGSAPGGGGGGGLSTGSAHAGGPGANGQVTITWTMTDPVTLPADTAGGTWQFQAPLGATAVTAQAWGAGAGGYNTGTAGGTSVAGFSAFTNIYGSPDATAATTADGYIGQPLCLSAQARYYMEEEYPSSGSDSQHASAMAAIGCKVVFVFKLSRRAVVAGGSTLAAQQSAFAAGLAYLQSIPSLNFYVVLGNEPNAFGVNGPFGNGTMKDWNLPTPYGPSVTKAQCIANFLAYHAAYVPTAVSAGVKVAYKPVVFSTGIGISMFPGAGSANGGADLILADWYAQDYVANSEDLFGASNIEGVADTAGIPLGIGEWAVSGSGNTGPTPSDWVNTWMPHFTGGFQNRLTANKPVADIIYFGGSSAGGVNCLTGSSDYKCPGIASVYTLLNQVTPAGGAGGGGGEFAEESSLAITGLSSYTIAVGEGGADRASGTSSTIVGDSVTVTAHGGSVATAVGTGGAGGTGSGNSTHEPGGAGGAGGGADGGGGGGGSSGGTAAGGNAGAAGGANFGGAGGTASTGGGPGGKGGGPAKNGAPPVSGPGGGGGARGANGLANGPGADGQITLSSFVTHPSCTGSFGLAPLGFAGQSIAPAGDFALAPLALAGTATVSNFTQTQLGTVASGTGSAAPTCSATAQYSTLFAVVTTTGNTAITAPQGWVQDVTVTEGGGTNGITTIWRYSAQPGGITSVTFTGGGGDTIRAFLLEVATPPGWTAAPDTSNTANGAGPATSFPVSTGSANAGADMAISAFIDRFSTSTSGSWTTPAGWTLLRSQTSITNWFAGYVQYGLAASTHSVTGTASTSTNQTGWGAALATYTIVPLVTSAGSLALAPLALAGTGSAVLGPGQIATSGAFALAPLAFQSPSQATTFPQDPLPLVAEILINGTWTDISSYVYQRTGATITGRGRPNEAANAQPAQVTLTLNNRDGSFSPANTAGQFYPFLVRNTQIRLSVAGVVTPQGANYTGYRFWGEVTSWPPRWDPSGSDVYVEVPAAGVLQRMRQSKAALSPLYRYYNNLTGALVPAAYWACEDASSATSFASGISGGSPMTWSGTPSLAANTNVPGSAAFAELSSSVWTGTPGAFSSGGVTFATPGTYQWTCPGGVTSILAECWGGGGGGSDGRFGCGGGGGEYAAEPTLAVTPGKTYQVVVGAGGSGGSGTFSLSGNAGQPGSMSVFSGDAVTVTAHPGKGLSANSGHAAGGTGSQNTTAHPGGSGGQFRSAGQGGSGGGGSGGSSSGGNGGSRANSATGASGGAAVTGGGPGGAGGLGAGTSGQALPGNSPSPGPGGGGGGGGFNQSNQFGERGGNGFAGQVKLTFGTSVTPTANVMRFVMDVPSTGGTDGAFYGQILTSGTIADLHVKYHTGGNLEMVGKNSGGSQLFTTGSKSFGANNQPLLVSAELVQSGTGVKWTLTAIEPGATAPVATYTGTQSSATVGPVTQYNVNNASGTPETAATGIGHCAVQYAVDPILNLAPALAAYAGELAATRFVRLCGEQNVPAAIVGAATDTPQMGPQPTDFLVNLLTDCENADLGQMYETRDSFGLAYRTRINMQNQAPVVTLDYSLAQLAQDLQPTNDDQLTRNDVIITRGNTQISGSSYETTLFEGDMSVQDAPNGVGWYTYQNTANLFDDGQLPNYAAWVLTLGTVDEYRYPLIVIDLRRTQVSDGTLPAVASLDIADFLQLVNPPVWLPPGPVNQLCYGFAETLNAFEWTIKINAVPEDPYQNPNGFPTW